MPIDVTRAPLAAVLNAPLNDGEFYTDQHFGFPVPVAVKGVDRSLWRPQETWSDKKAFDVTAAKLVQMFRDNFANF